MLPNPFTALFYAPVASLLTLAYLLVLAAFGLLTLWAAGRNVLWLRTHYQEGWQTLLPFWYTVRATALLVIGAVDLLLIAAAIQIV